MFQRLEQIQEEYREYLSLYFRRVYACWGDRLVSAAVFGSVARGTATATSDLDVLLVGEGLPDSYFDRTRELDIITAKLRSEKVYHDLRARGRSGLISEYVFTPKHVLTHPPILLDIVDHGIVVYDRDSFLEKELEKIRKRLKELGARKVQLDGDRWYWILKPDCAAGEVVEI